MKAIIQRPSDFSRKIYFSEKNKNTQSLYPLQKEFDFEVIEQANETEQELRKRRKSFAPRSEAIDRIKL